MAYEWNDDNTESLAIAESAARLAELEAEYWATLGPSEREAEERTAAGTKALAAGRFADALADFDRAMALRPGTRLWPRGVALYGLGRYRDAASFLEQCALAFAHKFDDRPTTELLWAAAARAKLGEPSPYGTRRRQNDNDDESNPEQVDADFASALEAARVALGIGAPDTAAAVFEDAVADVGVGALEAAAQAAFADAFAARARLFDAHAAKAVAAEAEDYALAATLKADAVALAAAADAADARATAASAAAAAAAGAADGSDGTADSDAGLGTVPARLAAMLAQYPREPNPVLAAAWALFTGDGELEALGAVVARAQAAARAAPRPRNGARGDADPLGRVFLGHLYAGLWLDSTAAAVPAAQPEGATPDTAADAAAAAAAAAREAAAAAAAAHFTAAGRAAQVGGAFGAGYDAGFLEGLASAAAEWSTAAAGEVPVEEPAWT